MSGAVQYAVDRPHVDVAVYRLSRPVPAVSTLDGLLVTSYALLLLVLAINVPNFLLFIIYIGEMMKISHLEAVLTYIYTILIALPSRLIAFYFQLSPFSQFQEMQWSVLRVLVLTLLALVLFQLSRSVHSSRVVEGPYTSLLSPFLVPPFSYGPDSHHIESLMVLRDLGIQLEVARASGTRESIFIEKSELRAVVINEGITCGSYASHIGLIV